MKRERINTNIPKYDELKNSGKETVTKEYKLELITPMMGGDFESWKLDVNNPVRSAAIKGHLRFWWRTMQSEPDHKKLLRKENEIWGGEVSIDPKKSIKSRVVISIADQKVKNLEHIKDNKTISNYVKFPLISVENDPSIFIINNNDLQFILKVSFPYAIKAEVENTLKLWVIFGGIGARTRRGTGSLYCEKLLKDFNSMEDVKCFIDKVCDGENDPLDYPRLKGSQLFKKTDSDIKDLLDSYSKYRQDRGKGTKGGEKINTGRSFWPEPDAIRRITANWSSKPEHKPQHPDEKWFPRAAFGLPILTEFSTTNDPGNKGSPKAIELEPKEGQRYPSPMILKKIKLGYNKEYACCFVLNQKFPTKLKLIDKSNKSKEYQITGTMLPLSTKNKLMKTNDPLSRGETIYQHLARSLKMEEL